MRKATRNRLIDLSSLIKHVANYLLTLSSVGDVFASWPSLSGKKLIKVDHEKCWREKKTQSSNPTRTIQIPHHDKTIKSCET